MSEFSYLRKSKFEPKFILVSSLEEAADFINRPHEDYPHRVQATQEALEITSARLQLNNFPSVHNFLLCSVHAHIFPEASWRGVWRTVNVIVGDDKPPLFYAVPALMDALEKRYKVLSTPEQLVQWYIDFETIHPFQDGNGRVGGVLYTANMYYLTASKEIWAPVQ